MEYFRLRALRHREQRVDAPVHRFPQRLRRARKQLLEAVAFDPAAGAEQLPGRDVAEHDLIIRIGQHQRERGRLDDRVEQELALVEVEPLAAQAVAERVVLGREVADLVRARRRDADAVVAVAQAPDGVRDRAQLPAPATEHAVREPQRERHRDQQGRGARQRRRLQPAVEGERDGRDDPGRRHDNHRDAAGERPPGARVHAAVTGSQSTGRASH